MIFFGQIEDALSKIHIRADCSTKNSINTSLTKTKTCSLVFQRHVWASVCLDWQVSGSCDGEKEREDNSQQSSGINLTALHSLFPSALVSVPPPLKIGHSPRSLQFKSLSLYSGSESLVEDDWHVALSKPGRKTPRSISDTDQPNHTPVGHMCDFMEKTCGEVHELSRVLLPNLQEVLLSGVMGRISIGEPVKHILFKPDCERLWERESKVPDLKKVMWRKWSRPLKRSICCF